MGLISDCCGASPRGNGDNDLSDYGICSDCGEHCEYIEEDEEDENVGSISTDQLDTDVFGNCYSDADPGL